jgi:sulfur-carrier protein adenylyltransferase/sulfurtransferase
MEARSAPAAKHTPCGRGRETLAPPAALTARPASEDALLEVEENDGVTLSNSERERYQRHLALAEIGVAGQAKLKAARVLIVGAGGLGSPAALYLAAAGCGTLGLLDCDGVELSNLQRQVLFDSAALGRNKAEAGRERLNALNPTISVIAHGVELSAANVRDLFAQYDLILDGTDRLSTRYLINDACVLMRLPLVSAAIHRFEGHVMTYVPGRGPCYRCVFPQAADGMVANCAEAGVLGVLPGVIGTLQATEAIKLITGAGAALIGRLLTYDALDMSFAQFRVAQRADCAVCGEAPTITQVRSTAGHAGRAGVRLLSARDLHALLGKTQSPPPLIDVREVREYDVGHLAGSVNIPLGELPARLSEIPANTAPVFICRSGGRSLAACQLALRAQIGSPANLQGGLLAWASDIDPALRVL